MNTCNYCNRVIKNKGGLVTHELSCGFNPNRTHKTRSIQAGVKKGTTSPLKGRKFGRNSYWDLKYPIEKILVENSTYPRHSLKKRILDNNLIPYVCSCCSISPIWNGNPMPLILDHINGINNDNRLENLRFVCSNCDSQLSTYKSRNIKKFI